MIKCPNFPNCLFEYSRKFSDPLCPQCQIPIPMEGRNVKFDVKIQYEPPTKKKRNSKKHHEVIKIDDNIFSVYHHMSLRSFVRLAQHTGDIHFCDHSECLNRRSLVIKDQNKDVQFECRHILAVLEALSTKALGVNEEWRPEYISKQDVETEVKNHLSDSKEQILCFLKSVENFVMLKLADDLYTMT